MATHNSKPSKNDVAQELYEDGKKANERKIREAEERLKEATNRFEEQFRAEHLKREEAESKIRQLAMPLFDELFDYFDMDPENATHGGKRTFIHKLNSKLLSDIINPGNTDNHWIRAEIVDKKLQCASYYLYHDTAKLKLHDKISITIDDQFTDFEFEPLEKATPLSNNYFQEVVGVSEELLRHISSHYFKKIEVNIHGSGRMLAANRVMSDDEKKAIFQTVGFSDALCAIG